MSTFLHCGLDAYAGYLCCGWAVHGSPSVWLLPALLHECSSFLFVSCRPRFSQCNFVLTCVLQHDFTAPMSLVHSSRPVCSRTFPLSTVVGYSRPATALIVTLCVDPLQLLCDGVFFTAAVMHHGISYASMTLCSPAPPTPLEGNWPSVYCPSIGFAPAVWQGHGTTMLVRFVVSTSPVLGWSDGNGTGVWALTAWGDWLPLGSPFDDVLVTLGWLPPSVATR